MQSSLSAASPKIYLKPNNVSTEHVTVENCTTQEELTDRQAQVGPLTSLNGFLISHIIKGDFFGTWRTRIRTDGGGETICIATDRIKRLWGEVTSFYADLFVLLETV